uniref:Uncharacterized protein n=1 Tax=Arundo donax TaxID=35708 RepID=A0A0A8ZYG3_ARUDO
MKGPKCEYVIIFQMGKR